MNLSPLDVVMENGEIDRYDEICQIGERPFIARMVYEGMRPRRSRALIYREKEPMVEIYDGRHLGEGNEPGQLISSYYYETLIKDYPVLCERGLNLQGGVKEWGMTGEEFKEMMRWAMKDVEKENIIKAIHGEYKETIAENKNTRVDLVYGYRILGKEKQPPRYEIISYIDDIGNICSRGVPVPWRTGITCKREHSIRLVQKETETVIAETGNYGAPITNEWAHALSFAVNAFKGMKENELTIQGFREVLGRRLIKEKRIGEKMPSMRSMIIIQNEKLMEYEESREKGVVKKTHVREQEEQGR